MRSSLQAVRMRILLSTLQTPCALSCTVTHKHRDPLCRVGAVQLSKGAVSVTIAATGPGSYNKTCQMMSEVLSQIATELCPGCSGGGWLAYK